MYLYSLTKMLADIGLSVYSVVMNKERTQIIIKLTEPARTDIDTAVDAAWEGFVP